MADLIYGLADPRTRECRYVGKTGGSLDARKRKHVSHAKSGRKQHAWAWIRTLLAIGMEPEIFLIEETETWREAEEFWIAYLRFIGCDLTNLSPGGDGIPMSMATADKIRATRIALRLVPSRIAVGNSLATRGRLWCDAEWRKLRVDATSEAQKRLWSDPAHREKMREARRISMSPERSAAMQLGVVCARARNGGVDVRAKLSVADVKRIRALRADGSAYSQIVDLTGAKRGTVVAICLRKTWKHVA